MPVDVTAEDLALYLGLSEIDGARAELMIEQAILLAESIVTPLPEAASAVVLAVAGRAYANPQGVAYETVGPVSVQRPQAGLYMTRDERRTLQRLAGRGGAFTVDPTPADADPEVTWPQEWDPDRDDPRGGWVDLEAGW
ncbi:hypothetical protein GCM10023085_45460 [Actinomadura viridis]|uniref:Head-to-tail adaptor n=1 Tax=Actinomadura viridis TaxID=58110 RepID=A0A931DLR8_9ACTN|nr:hypothetical protein [Actinomadura viridis]MBG6089906.1 hypothetical protein [Actinomadura viridis]